MKRTLAWLLAPLLTLWILSGCTTLADARGARGTGLSRIYSADFETVWKAVPQAASAIGLSIAGENKQERYILAQRGMTLLSYGENVAIFVEPVSARQTKVEVVSKRALQTNIFAPDWAPELLEKLGQQLPR